jgi:hypothetical protein
LLEVLHDPLGEHLPGIVRRVFLEDPAQQIAAPRDREADRECELVAERVVIHRRACSYSLLANDSPVAAVAVKDGSSNPR